MLQTNQSARNFLYEAEINLSDESALIHYAAIHEADVPVQVQAKPQSSRKQVFYYYLNMLPSALRTRFYSTSLVNQKAIKRVFRDKYLATATQAISCLTLGIACHTNI